MDQISGKRVIRAGETLIKSGIAESDPESYSEALEILSYWRACHEGPMELAFGVVQKVAERVDRNAVVASRLKRSPSIIGKLVRFPSMKLKGMQDIGGCRAIVSSEKRVEKVVRDLKKISGIRVKDDYLKNPKPGGYRSVHLVGKFPSTVKNIRTIEIQVRSAIQHSWATAVEIVDLFTGQAIKSNQGRDEWRRFFFYASEVLAYMEEIPWISELDPGQKARKIYDRMQYAQAKKLNVVDSANRLYAALDDLSVQNVMAGFATSLKVADERMTESSEECYALLEIDLKAKNVQSTLLPRDDFKDQFLSAEKRASDSGHNIVVALLSTDAVGGLKEAFPNYYADSTVFSSNLESFRAGYAELYPGGFRRTMDRIFGSNPN